MMCYWLIRNGLQWINHVTLSLILRMPNVRPQTHLKRLRTRVNGRVQPVVNTRDKPRPSTSRTIKPSGSSVEESVIEERTKKDPICTICFEDLSVKVSKFIKIHSQKKMQWYFLARIDDQLLSSISSNLYYKMDWDERGMKSAWRWRIAHTQLCYNFVCPSSVQEINKDEIQREADQLCPNCRYPYGYVRCGRTKIRDIEAYGKSQQVSIK